MYWDGTLSGGIETSTRNLHLSTNEPQAMSLSSSEPWEIELNQPQAQSQMNIRPLAKSGLRSAEPTLEISQMSGNAGVFTLNVLSTSDQATGFTVRGLNSGNEVYVEVNSMGNYFTIESLQDNNVINWNCYDDQHLLEYSLDEGETWETMTLTEDNGYYIWSETINTGDTIKFRGNNDTFGNYSIGESCRFMPTKRYNVYGNIKSLLRKSDFNYYSLLLPYTFYNLFAGTRLINASDLILPAELTEGCFNSMFNGCTSLITAPELPALSVPNQAYANMFSYCSNLVTAPALPATILGSSCYMSMFDGCSSLVNAPSVLPALFVKDRSYNYMFEGCSALTTAPEISATILSGNSCENMFTSCTSLTSSPVLLAKTLPSGCYSQMFSFCTNLEEITCLATDISDSSALNN